MWGNKLARITDKLYKNPAEPYFLYIWIIFIFLSFGDIWQEKQKMDQQWCWIVYSDCIIHQATGLGLAWVPRVHRCLMAWQVVSRLSGPDQNAAGCWTETQTASGHPADSAFRAARHTSWGCSFRRCWLVKRGLQSWMMSLRMATWPEDRTSNITDEGKTMCGCEGSLIFFSLSVKTVFMW